jgi:hypothetical protein
MSDTPTWLKVMEHGAIGEARAKAFLLDRFWVLERSVDIEGADFLIQRRLTGANFLNREPPRLGVIQVKFIQDAATNVHVKSENLASKDGSPHDEFFVLVFSGHEDKERCFLLSAKEVSDTCSPSSGKKPDSHVLAGKRLVTNGDFEVTSKKRALDRIEHALINADFMKNRAFIGSSNYVKLTPDQIENDFLLPLDNGYADIQKAFYEDKKKLQRTLFDLEEVTEAIGKILRSTDPEVAFQIFEKELAPFLTGGHSSSISIGCDAFGDEDFLAVIKNHKRRLAKLKKLGLAEPYFDLFAAIEKTVVGEVAWMDAVGELDVVKVMVEYEPRTLKNSTITVSPSSRESKKFPVIKDSKLGRHDIYFKPWDWLSWEVRTGKASAPKGRDEIREAILRGAWIFRRVFQKEIDRNLLGEELVSPWE